MNILNVEKVSKTYGEKELFNNISLGINSGDKIGLIGVNGTGKSTLLKIIAGVEEPDEGQVVKGKGIELAYLAQTPLYYDNENVLEYVMRGKHADSQPKAKEILNKLGITNHGAMMNILSGGQKKRAALARTLVEPARLLIAAAAVVAMTMAAGIMAAMPGVAQLSPVYLAAMVCAINGGATAFSHVNDSGFWLVSSLVEMDDKTTLKSWTIMETIVGLTGLVCAVVISLFA